MLLRTSVVDRLNGELADLLADRPGCEQMLLALEDANAFVVSLDAQRTWFRYHHLLADFLRLELRRTMAEQVPDLHRKAAAWLGDHGEVVEAIRHRLAAGDWSDAAGLLADHLFSLTLDGQEGSIAGLLRSFPAGASAEHPELALAHAATQLAQGRLDEASAQLQVAASHVERTARPPSSSRDCTRLLRLALARRSGQFAEVVEQVNLLDASTADGSIDLIGMESEFAPSPDEPWDRREMVRPIRRLGASRDRRSDARPGHRPTLHRSRVSPIKRFRHRSSRSRRHAKAVVRRSPSATRHALRRGRCSRPRSGR
jgi:LuxR family maltose regulon positive regulatory protein